MTPLGRALSRFPVEPRLARMLLAAKRPVIHAGQGVMYAGATDELRRLAELLQAPVMTTLPGKSAFPENHRLALGASAVSTTKQISHFLAQADCVFGIGTTRTPGGTSSGRGAVWRLVLQGTPSSHSWQQCEPARPSAEAWQRHGVCPRYG